MAQLNVDNIIVIIIIISITVIIFTPLTLLDIKVCPIIANKHISKATLHDARDNSHRFSA